MNFTDVELVRTRLMNSTVPAQVGQEYLQVLSNLNALSVLLSPANDEEMEGLEQAQLGKLSRDHRTRRAVLEAEYPELALLSRPKEWSGN
ncbi:hypothetical protein RDMS_12745 [Deinococcus sp. RL]|uniref:hypothetical protein n=1 Tax=Deinococcus sp. RL TaxID=1489678 RepID=UPI0004D9077E|nr:hypothetical protein [Deinococcus sp. RL]KEF33373.1 hypothetical protein RDMS_12745 [Deinococcus sp. RL]